MDNLQPIVIKHRYTDAVLYSGEHKSISEAVAAALESGANLSGANLYAANLSKANLSVANLYAADLSKANLSKANLSGANLYAADLSKANLSKANLSGASLSGADLSEANLSGADLSGADLSEADLSKANLSKANLSWADLSKANLSGANLSGANLSAIKTDLLDVLSHARNEAGFLLAELEAGRINGTMYDGACCCLIGTIAKCRGSHYTELDGIQPDSHRPIERWFYAIRPGDTPENSQIAKITAGWIREFLETANV